MKLINTFSVLSTLALVGCGTHSKKNGEAVAPVQETEAAAPETAAPAVVLPAAALVRVPVGADGTEDLTKAELRLQDQPTTVAETEIAAAFDKAATIESLAKEDELDKTSSTQSWFFGRYSGGYYNNYRFNNCFQPNYYAYGNSYAYNSYPQTYGYGGYNYYYYSRPAVYASYGYSSYGAGFGGGYGY